jgi:hypothetical protein
MCRPSRASSAASPGSSARTRTRPDGRTGRPAPKRPRQRRDVAGSCVPRDAVARAVAIPARVETHTRRPGARRGQCHSRDVAASRWVAAFAGTTACGCHLRRGESRAPGGHRAS